MIRCDVILHFQHNLRLDLIRKRLVFGEGLDVRTAYHFYLTRAFRWRNNHVVVYLKLLRHIDVEDRKV